MARTATSARSPPQEQQLQLDFDAHHDDPAIPADDWHAWFLSLPLTPEPTKKDAPAP